MKILMLGVKEYPYGVGAKYEKFPGGGTARYVTELSEGLAKKGNEVHMVVRQFPGQKKFEKVNGIFVHRVQWLNNRYLRLPTFNAFSFFECLKIAKHIDIIHTHGSFAALVGVTLGKIYKKKVVGTTHGLTSDQAKYKYHKWAVACTKFLEKTGYSKLDKIFFLSKSEKNLVTNSLSITPKKSEIIFPGITSLNVKQKKTSKFKVTFIGRLVPMKGLDKFIESYNLLSENVKKNTEYIIVGDGYFRKNLQDLVKSKNLTKNIKFTGYTNHIHKYLVDASIFILPSEGGEGLPCALLEAMSAGIPCMVSNFRTPAPENAIYNIKNNNPITIAKNIDLLYNDRKLLNSIGKEAKKIFIRDFSVNATVKNHLRAYKE